MSDSVDGLTANWEQDGQLLVKENGREVLSKGAWATILFKYQELDRQSGDYGPPKISLRRYRKVRGQYVQQIKFNISSLQQARKIRDILGKWCDDEAEAEAEAEA